jgi:hypothetical protein
MTRHNKLRRQRKFTEEGAIQSQLPNTDVPHSRRYTRQGVKIPAGLVVTAPPNGLTLHEVSDRIVCGDSVSVLRQLPDNWCSATITSPPYWHTVDYGVNGQIGLHSYEKYLDDLDLVWAEVARVLLPNGKFCLNVPILPLTKDISETAFGPSHPIETQQAQRPTRANCDLGYGLRCLVRFVVIAQRRALSSARSNPSATSAKNA